MAWKLSRWPGNFPDCLENYHMAWKVSIGLESIHIAKASFLMSEQSIPEEEEKITKTYQVYKNIPGSIATLLPWFFRL